MKFLKAVDKLICVVVLVCCGYGECLDIVSREDCDLRDPVPWCHGNMCMPLQMPVEIVVVAETDTYNCSTRNECCTIIQEIQNFYIDILGRCDLPFNFLIGDDGQVYQGRGWYKMGTHSRCMNCESYSVAFIGSFENDLPTVEARDALCNLTKCGIDLGFISSSAECVPHDSVSGDLARYISTNKQCDESLVETQDATCECQQIECGIREDLVAEVTGDEAQQNQIPWQVGIGNDTDIYCGGVIIHCKYVLTAAHCKRSDSTFVYVGNTEWGDSQKIEILAFDDHDGYNGAGNNIAIITLKDKITSWTPAIRPICLPDQLAQNLIPIPATLTVSGWGNVDSVLPVQVDKLRYAEVPIVCVKDCCKCAHTSKARFPARGELCYGLCYTPAGEYTGACHVDSGGPVTYKDGEIFKLIAVITALDKGCEGKIHPRSSDVYFFMKNWRKLKDLLPEINACNQNME